MTQPTEKLRQTVNELEGELAALEGLDTETREMLRHASTEIQAALDRQDAAGLEPQSIIDRLKESVREFEADHPTLAGALERVIHALGQIGI